MQEEIEGLREALKEYTEVMRRSNPSMNGGSNANINVSAGGIGIWVAATACIIMLSVLIVGGTIGGMWLSREFSRIDKELQERKGENERAQSYLSSIFLRAPQLNPDENKKVSKTDEKH